MENRDNRMTDERLAAAVKTATERYRPDQVVLFGPAASGTMTEHDQIDMLLITREHVDGRVQEQIMRVNEDTVDLLIMDAEAAESRRRTAGSVQHEALSRGRTVHCKDNRPPLVAIGPSRLSSEDGTVTSNKLDPALSADFLELALHLSRISDTANIHDGIRCDRRYEAVKQCLKGLITAKGRECHKNSRMLNELWIAAESEGERIPVVRDESLLDQLTSYTDRNDGGPDDNDKNRRLLADTESMTESLLRYAEEAIPRLSAETLRALAETPKLVKPSLDESR